MPSDLGLTSSHVRVDRNSLQMNEIRSMCSRETVILDRRMETALYFIKKKTKQKNPPHPYPQIKTSQNNKRTPRSLSLCE